MQVLVQVFVDDAARCAVRIFMKSLKRARASELKIGGRRNGPLQVVLFLAGRGRFHELSSAFFSAGP